MIGNASSGVPGGGLRAAAALRTATARWSPPADNGGAAVNGYVVTALKMGANGEVVRRIESPVLPGSSRSTVLNLRRGTYRFVVVAANRAGESKPSARSNRVMLR